MFSRKVLCISVWKWALLKAARNLLKLSTAEVAQQVKVRAAKPDHLGSIPGILTVAGDN